MDTKETDSSSSNQSSFGYDVGDLCNKLNCDLEAGKYEIDRSTESSKTRKIFPEKLFEVLQNNTDSDIISWILDGTVFAIKRKEYFEQILLPTYFHGIKFQSFQHQLNIYGFERINVSNKFAYKHEYFLKDHPELIKNIKRVPIKRNNL